MRPPGIEPGPSGVFIGVGHNTSMETRDSNHYTKSAFIFQK